MSDCFDHHMDAMEDRLNQMWGDSPGPEYSSFNYNPLFYFMEVKYDEIMDDRKKAMLIKINGLEMWVPKGMTKKHLPEEKKIYIQTKFLANKYREVHVD